jgi:hypothetical protein
MMMSRLLVGMITENTVDGCHDETDLGGVCCAGEMGVYLLLKWKEMVAYLFYFGLIE